MNSYRSHLLLVLAGFLLCHHAPAECAAQAYITGNGLAEFTSSVPLYTFTGTSEKLTGRIDLSDSTVDFYLDLETLETGIGKRDKDMRITLETEQYPFAEFYGKFVTPFDANSEVPQSVMVEGAFTIHGAKKQITVDGTLQNVEGGIRLDAEWTLNLTDYDIKPPRLLVIKVDEVQKIRISALLQPEEDDAANPREE